MSFLQTDNDLITILRDESVATRDTCAGSQKLKKSPHLFQKTHQIISSIIDIWINH
jgi:hypothetical protein